MKKSVAAMLLLIAVLQAHAQPIPSVGRDDYPGTLQLQVDLRDVDRRIVRVRETIPVRTGPLVLYLPKWIPGWHGPRASITQFAGLVVRAGDRVLDWKRNTVEMNAFHVDVPAGTTQLDIEFQHLSSLDGGTGSVDITPEIARLNWDDVLLYPAGHEAARIRVKARLLLPPGWRHASALEPDAADATVGGALDFKPVSVETLVDSPVLAGEHLRRIDLDPGARDAGRAPLFLNIVAEQPAELAASAEQIAWYAALVTQSDRLFGSRPFRHYDFLFGLSESFGFDGLEHHESSMNTLKPGYFTDWAKNGTSRFLLPHEFVHSWNGKFRRPADLLTPHYNVPMRDSLLWVYEGQTQFWGAVLTARSGLHSAAEAREDLAIALAWLDARAGRAWRNLQDTTNEPILGAGNWKRDWRSWSRGTDYYDEMRIVWIEADAIIRELSKGQHSMDDFARAFFGAQPGRAPADFRPLPYTFDEVVRTLNQVQPHDWGAFLRERLDARGGTSPSAMLRRAGWALAWREQPSDYFKAAEAQEKETDLFYSLGFVVGEGGKLVAVRWDGPAFAAGLASGTVLVAVNGRAYKADGLKEAVTAAKTSGKPIELLMKNGDVYKTVPIAWSGGLRYPALERIEGTPDHLGALLTPK